MADNFQNRLNGFTLRFFLGRIHFSHRSRRIFFRKCCHYLFFNLLLRRCFLHGIRSDLLDRCIRQLLQKCQLLFTKLTANGDKPCQLFPSLRQAHFRFRQFPAILVNLLLRSVLRFFQNLIPSGFRIPNDAVCHLLGGQKRRTHGIFRRTVFLHLFHQYLEFGFQSGVFLIKCGIVLGQLIQKSVNHTHIVTAHHRSCERMGGNFLWCQHIACVPPVLKI